MCLPFARYAKGRIAAPPVDRMRSNPAQYEPKESSIESTTKRYVPMYVSYPHEINPKGTE